MGGEASTTFRFRAEVIEWRGPSPFFFVPVPADVSVEVQAMARALSYGWGVIPVRAGIGSVNFTTSLFPKDGRYLLPVKAVVRRAADVTAGDVAAVEMTLNARGQVS